MLDSLTPQALAPGEALCESEGEARKQAARMAREAREAQRLPTTSGRGMLEHEERPSQGYGGRRPEMGVRAGRISGYCVIF